MIEILPDLYGTMALPRRYCSDSYTVLSTAYVAVLRPPTTYMLLFSIAAPMLRFARDIGYLSDHAVAGGV